MNQDFAVMATPALARRLLLLRDICKLTLPDAVPELAAQDCLDASAFDPMVCPSSPIRLLVSQFLLDCNLRGVVQADYHPEISPLVILNVVRRTDLRIVIVTDRRRPWANATTALALEARIITTLHALKDEDRHAVVIYDASYVGSFGANTVNHHLRYVARDCPRLIIFDQQRGFNELLHWSVFARLLFPTMPSPLYLSYVGEVPDHWRKSPISASALLYNVCIFPRLITDPATIAALEDDDYTNSRLRSQSRLLTYTL